MKPEEIRAARLAAGLTQQQLADTLGTTKNTVARWERGELTPRGLYARTLEQWAAGQMGPAP